MCAVRSLSDMLSINQFASGEYAVFRHPLLSTWSVVAYNTRVVLTFEEHPTVYALIARYSVSKSSWPLLSSGESALLTVVPARDADYMAVIKLCDQAKLTITGECSSCR